MAIAADAIPGQMHFLARDPKYLTEKPYTLRYAPGPDDDFPQTNIERVLHPLVFHDLRGCPDLKYETCGFMVTESPSAMAYDDYADTDKIEDVHVPEVVAAVKAALGAKSVEMLDYVVGFTMTDRSWSETSLSDGQLMDDGSGRSFGRGLLVSQSPPVSPTSIINLPRGHTSVGLVLTRWDGVALKLTRARSHVWGWPRHHSGEV